MDIFAIRHDFATMNEVTVVISMSESASGVSYLLDVSRDDGTSLRNWKARDTSVIDVYCHYRSSYARALSPRKASRSRSSSCSASPAPPAPQKSRTPSAARMNRNKETRWLESEYDGLIVRVVV
jgi:hypothetical protein